MTYILGGNIQTTDYNTFATASNGMNQVYADLFSGATTLPNAGFGYGQLPALTSVSGNITAAQWTNLFQTIRKCGTHQGTTVVPPLPVADPIIGNTVAVYNTPSTLASTIALLNTNKFNLAGGQTSVIVGTPFSNPAPWTTSLVYTFQVDFGSWNNARYFFNSGSSISVTGVYTPAPTPDEVDWQALFSTNFPVNMNWQTTTPASGGNNVVNPPGFYLNAPYPALTTSYQDLYIKYVGGGAGPYYVTNFAKIEAKLANIAGTNGKIDFRVTLTDADTFPVIKAAGRMTYTINRIQSAGAIAYPGSYAFTSGGFVAI
jgi:hypothetical protein